MFAERPLRQAGKGLANKLVDSGLGEKVGSIALREVAKSATEMFEIIDPNENIQKFCGLIKEGYYPIVVSNHLSLADVGAWVKIVDAVNQNLDQPKVFNGPVSISLGGKQGKFIEMFYGAIKPWAMKDHNINLIEVARYKDRKVHQYEATTDANGEVHDTIYTDRGMICLMEGHQEGGRTNKMSPTGEITGMIEVRNTQIPEQIRDSIREVGRDVAVLPMGIEMSYRILNPNNGMLPGEAWECIAYQKLLRTDPKLATVTIGEPITGGEMQAQGLSLDNLSGMNYYLAHNHITPLISEAARGVYK